MSYPRAPMMAPSPPVLISSSRSSITVQFDVSGIVTQPPSRFLVRYGFGRLQVPPLPPAQVVPDVILDPFAFDSFPATLVSGTTYQAVIPFLEPNTKYWMQSTATNFSNAVPGTGSASSVVVGPFSTTNSPDVPPSPAPSVPVVSGTPTSTSITVTFDTAGVTGTAPISYSVLVGTVPTPIPATLVSGTVYQAVATGLTPATAYTFKSQAKNDVGSVASVSSAPISTAGGPPTTALKTNVVIPFLIQGPRFGSVSPWDGVDYYITSSATGAVYEVGASAPSGAQIFGSMYAGTVGAPGNLSGDPGNLVPYAGACQADVPFNYDFGTTSDAYLGGVQTSLGSNGRVLASWGGFYADILGLFGPYSPPGYPGTQPTAAEVVQSFLFNYCGVSSPNPLNWRSANSTSTSSYDFKFDGLVLDFENVGAGNPLNSYPYAATIPPAFPAEAVNPTYVPYIAELASIVTTYYATAPTLFLGNAPVSLSLIADVGTTNICASNSALNTWYAFPTATVPPSAASYNATPSLALNHPEQLSYMNDIFVQFYNESAADYPGGANFPNLLACWGYVALEAQKLNRKSTKINLGLAKGNIIPGGGPPYVNQAQGPTPPLNGQTGPPYTYWYPQYATISPPNNTSNMTYDTWPNTGPTLDGPNVAAAITAANLILRTAQSNPTLQPSDWLSGMGFWAGTAATTMAQTVYTAGDEASPGSVLPALETYCWGDASYPAPNPQWPGNVPIVSTL